MKTIIFGVIIIILLVCFILAILTKVIVKDISKLHGYIYHNDAYWKIVSVSDHYLLIQSGLAIKRIHPLALTTRWYKFYLL